MSVRAQAHYRIPSFQCIYSMLYLHVCMCKLCMCMYIHAYLRKYGVPVYRYVPTVQECAQV